MNFDVRYIIVFFKIKSKGYRFVGVVKYGFGLLLSFVLIVFDVCDVNCRMVVVNV